MKTFTQAIESARVFDKTLQDHIFYRDHMVIVKHVDGHRFELVGAVWNEEDGYFRIFTEHLKPFVFPVDEVESIIQWAESPQ